VAGIACRCCRDMGTGFAARGGAVVTGRA
jgi:hypothetical protein